MFKKLITRALLPFVTILFLWSALFLMSVDGAPVLAQSSEEVSAQAQEDLKALNKLRSLHLPIPLPESLDRNILEADLQKRPLLAFRIWANKPKKFIPSFLFCLLTSVSAWTFFSRGLNAAKPVCRKHFWRSLFVGIFVCALTLLFSVGLFRSVIGTPLAVVLMGVLEFGSLLGLSVVVSLIGEAILVRTGLADSGYLAGHAREKQLVELIIGVAVICLVLLLPRFAGLPSVGIRVVMLLCQLGLGAFLHARKLAGAQSAAP